MQVSETGLALIRHFEGFAPTVYRCLGGKMTIGYGHVLTADETWPDGIDQETADSLLRADAAKAAGDVAAQVTVPLRQNQIDALVSFVFNLGGAAFARSRLRRKINQGLHDQAVEEFHRWVYAGGVRLKGLVRRRQAEAALYALQPGEEPSIITG